MLLLLAGEAAQARQFQTAYNIARQLDDALPPGVAVSSQPIGFRDNYTSLAWLAGTVALDRLNQPANAIRHVRPLRACRQVAPGPDQGLLLGGPSGARRWAHCGR